MKKVEESENDKENDVTTKKSNARARGQTKSSKTSVPS
eukprot:CAMPEP_0170170104 /NCGR_PEP_ID=MMETSP0040_2-20121228/3062_1 /TAXON_ID=641309 /ORGANISM="Lotharella oceanica, Strain CCMP622" /LENGTH=37 /DNA_ID= /DNA_START= /DNA_END= /DNA_ORIENTATION=